uniref:Putative secreted protein n=1 Tax=Ixodes ricinus TaxID=34613 RepID=A0A6B0U508_IXORI
MMLWCPMSEIMPSLMYTLALPVTSALMLPRSPTCLRCKTRGEQLSYTRAVRLLYIFYFWFKASKANGRLFQVSEQHNGAPSGSNVVFGVAYRTCAQR